ncbi:MAG: protein-L-isoaspartate O-methyltransferase [bacterium]
MLFTPRIISAFKSVPRANFLPKSRIFEAEINAPIPIGSSQTNSQPLTVAFMLEKLQPRPKQKVLDVGSGSGWTSALFAEIVGPLGHVYALERIPELKNFGQENVLAMGYQNVSFILQNGSQGLPKQAPYDIIHVAAASSEVPDRLIDQLNSLGRMIIPVGDNESQSLVLVSKSADKKISYQEFPGWRFVPLVT